MNFQKPLKHIGKGLFWYIKSVVKVQIRIQVDQDPYFGGKGVFLVKLAPKTDFLAHLKEAEFPKIIETRYKGYVLMHKVNW